MPMPQGGAALTLASRATRKTLLLGVVHAVRRLRSTATLPMMIV
jgi:hypothetical protein